MSSQMDHVISIYTRLIGTPVHAASVVPFGDVFFSYHVDLKRGILISSEFINSALEKKSSDARISNQDRTLNSYFKSHTSLSLLFGLPWPVFTKSTQKIYRYLIQHRQDVLTYGALAENVFGNVSYARVVATAMSHNFLPVFIPCHLVQKSAGKDAYSALGSKDRVDLKKQLVHCEGIHKATQVSFK
jgi:O6-methylguanine-DNA--protein-cysteine methyltransferase